MWNRGGSRSSALDRAKAQLSGQRVTNSGALREDHSRDVASFGKALHGLSDLSSDAESGQHDYHAHPDKIMRHSTEPVQQLGMGGGSRYLKKSTNRQTSSADTSEVKFIPQRSSQSLALSRLARIEDRIRSHTKNKLSIDADLDIKSGLSVQSSNELSAADGSCFLKKKASSPKDQEETENPHVDIDKAHAHSASHRHKGRSVDSDEEDMRKLLGESFKSPDGDYGMGQTTPSSQKAVQTYSKRSKEVVLSAQEHKEKHLVRSGLTAQCYMSPSPSPLSSRRVSSHSKSFSQRADLTSSLSSVQDHSEIRSLKELFPIASVHDETQSERSVLSDDFKVNLMTLDDLAPDTINIAELPKEKSVASPQELCVSSAGAIMHKKEDDPAHYESDFESEIQTEMAQTVDDISEYLSGENEHSCVASEPQSLINKSNHDDGTLSQKSSKSTSINYSKSDSSLTHRRGSDPTSYSTEDTQTHISPKIPSVRQCKKDATVQTKTEGLAYMWSSGQAVLGPSVGMSYMDPTPVASHMISAEAVEALTAYSPAVFALNDMLRQQLTLTRSFIQSSRHLHQAMLESLGPASYRYTTLEDTKEDEI
ncbi:C19orf44-like protein [Clarias magur]|uniref:C19orf44-like protein n=1 Tax=Clarias magur TaxID=1594786 RepID=A0A8J4U2X3_CLAMG|nr:C19orf44-like protein [Clarias magur]